MHNRKENGPLEWLLEERDPGVRYLAVRDLVRVGAKELAAAKEKAHQQGPIAQVLAKMTQAGYWEQPGAAGRWNMTMPEKPG